MPEEQLGGLDVAIDGITVGVRHRKELGDLQTLAASIEKLGLLQPITITPNRVLVCGWRRLEAVRLLGWTQVRTWIRSGLSDNALQLLAQHDENVLRAAYSKTEQARLYQEFKDVLREDARRRQEASRFGARSASREAAAPAPEAETNDSVIVGAVESTAPDTLTNPGGTGDLRDQAALLASGRKSWQALERIGRLMDHSVDEGLPGEIREAAAEAVARIEDGGQVAPEWDSIQTMLQATQGQAPAAETHDDADAPPAGPAAAPAAPAARVTKYALRVWATTWEQISRLLDDHDPQVLGPALPVRDWETLCDVQHRLTALVAAMETARHDSAASAGDVGRADTTASSAAAGEPDQRPGTVGSADHAVPVRVGAPS
ncbi:ParB N-terminal domain-containing protein [Myceligenerans crystallogenes]|uniref:ParB-like N-terminal domain-containing protein n=1 Tax=Myceligenerans crystallogenes TaxID=316335 RepID=A0ABN2NQ66_9MICO